MADAYISHHLCIRAIHRVSKVTMFALFKDSQHVELFVLLGLLNFLFSFLLSSSSPTTPICLYALHVFFLIISLSYKCMPSSFLNHTVTYNKLYGYATCCGPVLSILRQFMFSRKSTVTHEWRQPEWRGRAPRSLMRFLTRVSELFQAAGFPPLSTSLAQSTRRPLFSHRISAFSAHERFRRHYVQVLSLLLNISATDAWWPPTYDCLQVL